MFRGRYEHTVDTKGRLSIPAKYREVLLGKGDDRLIITNFVVSSKRCLDVYPLDEWTALEEAVRQRPKFDPNMVRFQTYYLGGATESEVDTHGRILIPPTLRRYADLKRNVMLASAGELKRKRRWLIGTCFGWAVSTAALASATSLPLAMVIVAVFGWMSAWNMALNRGLIQSQVDMRMRGRVMSIDMMSHGLMPLGMIPLGWVADTFGVASALAVSGVLFAVSVAALKWLSPAVRRVGRPVVAVSATR